MGGMVPLYRLSGTFLQNNSSTIPLVSENQEKSWKHRFLTFKYKIKSTKNKKRSGVSRNPGYLTTDQLLNSYE